jgi:putative glutamine amidotransferase
MTIGITYTGKDEKHRNYVRWLQNGDSRINVLRLDKDGPGGIDKCDALVLSGGVDIAPEFYDGTIGYAQAPEEGWQRDRDLFEMALLEGALERGMPVLGVCRGLQLINVALGGGLVQDLGAGDAMHEGISGVDKEHGVIVGSGTLLGEIAGLNAGVVNSAHHQAVGRLAEGLRVNCRGTDGTIEGVEWAEPEGKTFLLGVQWHPERMFVNGVGDEGFYKAVRERFINEINKRDANH